MQPLRDLVLITLDEREKQTQSGIFIEKAWEDAVNTGTVEAVGNLVESCKPGDRVYFNPFAYLDISGMKQQKVIREGDILGHVG